MLATACAQVVERGTGANGVTGKPASARKVFSRIRFCVDVQHRAGRSHRRVSAAAAAVVGGHVLELEGDDRHMAREFANRVEIVIRRRDFDVGDLAGRRVGLGRKRVDAIAHPPRSNREHAAKLAAAEHAQGRLPAGSASCELVLANLARLLLAEGAKLLAQSRP